jgi:peptidoglycan-N-acetylglucosamine deacetylase
MFDLTISFDNGPEPEVTPGVLDVLARRGIASTFFVIGQKLGERRARACAERAQAEGHWIGNHTFTHSRPLGEQPAEAAVEEMSRTQAALGALAHPYRLFRPMGGGGHLDRRLLNPAAAALLAADGYTCVLWNAVPRDWADPEGWLGTALAQLVAQPWTLMVLHDLPTGAMRHLDRFLGAARDRGARFRQDFPPACLPVVAGRVTQPLGPYGGDPP